MVIIFDGAYSLISLALTLLSLIAATLMAWMFLGESIVAAQATGILVVVIALTYLALTTNVQKSQPKVRE